MSLYNEHVILNPLLASLNFVIQQSVENGIWVKDSICSWGDDFSSGSKKKNVTLVVNAETLQTCPQWGWRVETMLE